MLQDFQDFDATLAGRVATLEIRVEGLQQRMVGTLAKGEACTDRAIVLALDKDGIDRALRRSADAVASLLGPTNDDGMRAAKDALALSGMADAFDAIAFADRVLSGRDACTDRFCYKTHVFEGSASRDVQRRVRELDDRFSFLNDATACPFRRISTRGRGRHASDTARTALELLRCAIETL